MEEQALFKPAATGQMISLEDAAMSISNLKQQADLIKQVMTTVMKEDEHYGIIPGTSKPTLLKPGAEKLGMVFRLAADYEIIEKVRDQNFIAYTVKCVLTHIPTGQLISSGLGSCNSRENKYRYRSENTGKEVPKEFWQSRSQNLLGGPQYHPRKVDKKWMIYEQIETDNPWDVDNTLIKMACKRSHISAMLSATAASDIFDTGDPRETDADISPDADTSKTPKITLPVGGGNSKYSESQKRRIEKIGQNRELSTSEIEQLIAFHKSGAVMTVPEASDFINRFDEILDAYIDQQRDGGSQ